MNVVKPSVDAQKKAIDQKTPRKTVDKSNKKDVDFASMLQASMFQQIHMVHPDTKDSHKSSKDEPTKPAEHAVASTHTSQKVQGNENSASVHAVDHTFSNTFSNQDSHITDSIPVVSKDAPRHVTGTKERNVLETKAEAPVSSVHSSLIQKVPVPVSKPNASASNVQQVSEQLKGIATGNKNVNAIAKHLPVHTSPVGSHFNKDVTNSTNLIRSSKAKISKIEPLSTIDSKLVDLEATKKSEKQNSNPPGISNVHSDKKMPKSTAGTSVENALALQNSTSLGAIQSQNATTIMPTMNIQSPNATQTFQNIVVNQVQANSNSVTVQIHPEGMGQIQISLEQNSNGGINVQVQANNPQTVQWFQSEQTQITNALRSGGFDVSQMQISYQQQGDTSRNAHQDESKKSKRVNAVEAEPSITESITPSYESYGTYHSRSWFA